MIEIKSIKLAEEKSFNGITFPLTLSPSANGSTEFKEVSDWVSVNKGEIDILLLKHKAILFRNTGAKSHDDFHAFVEATGYAEMDYVGGAAVRTQLTSRVFTANESPSSEKIPFHHEMAQTPKPPTHLFFFCVTPPSVGGETPILISNEVYRRMHEKHEKFMETIEREGVKYVRYMPETDDSTSAIGRGWKSTFLCDEKGTYLLLYLSLTELVLKKFLLFFLSDKAESALKALGSTWEWQENGILKTVTATIPAVRTDEGPHRSNQKTFFNSMVAAYTGWNDSRNDGRKAVLLGNGEPIEEAAMQDALQVMEEVCVAFRWQQGDILLLDNRTTMHARRPFEGSRRILASLGRDAAR